MKRIERNLSIISLFFLILCGVVCSGCRSAHVGEVNAKRTEFRITSPANSLFVSSADSSRSKRNEINDKVSANWHRDLIVGHGPTLCTEP